EHGADVALDRQAAEDRRLLGQVADPQTGAPIHRQVGDVHAIQTDRAVIGLEQPGDHIEAGGLAGAVGPEQSHRLAAPHLQVDVAQDQPRLEALAEAARLEAGGLGHQTRPRRRLAVVGERQIPMWYGCVQKNHAQRYSAPSSRAAADCPGPAEGWIGPSGVNRARTRCGAVPPSVLGTAANIRERPLTRSTSSRSPRITLSSRVKTTPPSMVSSLAATSYTPASPCAVSRGDDRNTLPSASMRRIEPSPAGAAAASSPLPP